MKIEKALSKIILGIERVAKSIRNFFKSSFVSLLVIAIVLLILLNMEQAYTMMTYMLETDEMSLLLCFFFVNALALSHYPIYTYYSLDLNDSSDKFDWSISYPFKRVLKMYEHEREYLKPLVILFYQPILGVKS